MSLGNSESGINAPDRAARVTAIRDALLPPIRSVAAAARKAEDAARTQRVVNLIPDLDEILSSVDALYEMISDLEAHESIRAFLEGGDPRDIEKTIRHDLRTPLNGIIGFGDMLLADLDDVGGESLKPEFVRLLEKAKALHSILPDAVNLTDESINVHKATPAGTLFDLHARPRSVHPQLVGRVLVVDDNATNRDLLSRGLKREGHSVATADGGAAAIRMIDGEDFDLVLLDVMMPEVDGLDVLHAIKINPAHRDIPVIMISAMEETDGVIRCIEEGAEDYILKPFDAIFLKARINASLERKQLRDRERRYLEELETAKRKNEQLLLNILPRPIISRLGSETRIIADHHENVTVLFADIVGFTPFAMNSAPEEVVQMLNDVFSRFDDLAQEHGVEKIKTIGDAYMAACGLPEPCADHAKAVADLALAMMERVDPGNEDGARIRIGIHSGPVVAGVIGKQRFSYDLWGDTVNVASRVERESEPGRILVSADTHALLGDGYCFEPRGSLELRGRGTVDAYYLTGQR